MPTAPDNYKSPSSKIAKDFEQHDAGNSRETDEPNFYAHRRYRNFRERIKKKQRALDEQRIHDIYKSLNSRSYSDYMGWLSQDNPLCVDCLDKGVIQAGRVMDHIIPIEQGGPVYKESNLQWLCDHHHNAKSGKESHTKPSTVRIIAGAPGSGKTHYVREHVKPGDIVFDLDEIYRALSFQPGYQKPDELKDIVFRVRDRVYRAIRESNDIKRAWVIVSYPEADKRKELQQKLNGDLFLLSCPPEICKQRIRDQQRPEQARWDKVVDHWFETFEPVEEEQIIKYGSGSS